MSWDTILFDLDGTLTDPGVGITKAVYRALTGMGVAVEDLNSLKRFIGPPLDEAFAEYYGFSVQQSEEAVLLFREYYNEVGWLENIPYDGIEVLLKKLRACGKRLAVATSKPENIALRVLNYFSLAPYFDCQRNLFRIVVHYDYICSFHSRR